MNNPFKSLASFSKQLEMVLAKSDKALSKLEDAQLAVLDAEKGVLDKADEIRGEADALIVRANQINKMVDAVVGKTPQL